MKTFKVTNTELTDIITRVQTAGGTFNGLAAGESMEVGEAMAMDLSKRFAFLSIEEVIVEPEAEAEALDAEEVSDETSEKSADEATAEVAPEPEVEKEVEKPATFIEKVIGKRGRPAKK